MFSTTARVILLTYKIMSLVNPLRMKTNMIPTACKNLWDWALIIALSPFPMALLHHHAGLLLWLKPYQVPFALDPVPAFPCACEAFLLSAPWLSFISVKNQRNSFQTTLFEIALTPTPFPSFLLCFSKPLIHLWFVLCSTATCGHHSASYPLLHEDKEFLYLCPQCLEQCLTYCGGLVNICWINDWRNEMHLINLKCRWNKKIQHCRNTQTLKFLSKFILYF